MASVNFSPDIQNMIKRRIINFSMKIILGFIFFYYTILFLSGQGILYTENEAEFWLNQAKQNSISNPQVCLVNCRKILDSLETNNFIEYKIKAYRELANAYKILGKVEQAINAVDSGIILYQSYDDPCLLQSLYTVKISIYTKSMALDSMNKYSLAVLAVKCKDTSVFNMVTAYRILAKVQNEYKNYNLSEEFLLKGFEIGKGKGIDELYILLPLIRFYREQQRQEYYEYVRRLIELDYLSKMGPENFMTHYSSYFYLDNATPKEKELRLKEIIRHYLLENNVDVAVNFSILLSQHYKSINKLRDAENCLLPYVNGTHNLPTRERKMLVSESLYQIEKLLKKPEQALIYFEETQKLKDSIYSLESIKKINELNIKFETLQKDHEIESQKNKIQIYTFRNQAYLSYAIAISILGLIIYLYYNQRNKAQKETMIKDKLIYEQEKLRLIQEKKLGELQATIEGQENERHRLARDLHDGMGSLLAGISMQLQSLNDIYSTNEKNSFNNILELVQDAGTEMRRISYELMPLSLTKDGLKLAIQNLCYGILEKNNISYKLECSNSLDQISQSKQVALYRIIQEVLHNIRKHAHAKQVLIQLLKFENEGSLMIEDDGVGFDVNSKLRDGGIGLISIQNRLQILEGQIDIASEIGIGTSFTINFPI